MRESLVILGLIAVATTAQGETGSTTAPVPRDPRELPHFMVPIPQEAAEAYWAPDSRHLIAQTRDPDAVKTHRGGNGALTWIFTDDGKESWRVNDRGQDACSFFFPDGKTIVWTSTRDNLDMPLATGRLG